MQEILRQNGLQQASLFTVSVVVSFPALIKISQGIIFVTLKMFVFFLEKKLFEKKICQNYQ